MGSVGDFEVVSTHLGLQQVGLGYHSIDVDLHNSFREGLVVQLASLGVFPKKGLEFVLLEVAAELVQSFFELREAAVLSVFEIEVKECLLASLPFVGLPVALFPDLFIQG